MSQSEDVRQHPEEPARADSSSNRHLRAIVAASMLSKIADWQLGIVVPLAVLAQTRSVAAALVAFTLRWLPYIASPVLGSIIDRYDKRTVFTWAQLMQAFCMAGVALLIDNRIAVGLLLLLSGFGAVAVTITGTFVLIPKLIEQEQRPVAVAKLSSAIELSKVVGLLLGGLLSATVGPRPASWGIAALYVLAGLVAWLLLPGVPGEGTRTKIRHDLGVGFRWLAKPDILWLVVTMATANLAVGEMETVLVTIFGDAGINEVVISGVLGVGLFMGAVGSRVCPHILPNWPVEQRVLLFQVMALASLLIIAVPNVVVTIVGYACLSFSLGGSNVASITYRQETIPVELAGRVNSVIRMFITGAIPLSGFLYAWATRLDGLWFWAPGLVLAIFAVLVWAGWTFRIGKSTGRPREVQPVEG